jgi:hypothetical protein
VPTGRGRTLSPDWLLFVNKCNRRPHFAVITVITHEIQWTLDPPWDPPWHAWADAARKTTLYFFNSRIEDFWGKLRKWWIEKLMVPSESELSNEWSCQKVSTILNFRGEISVSRPLWQKSQSVLS